MQKKEYQALTIPRLAWNNQTLNNTFGEVTASPLDPGFGITFGNALRRILYGGIEGSAVTSVIVQGVNNEFSPLPGVEQDAMQLLLNIKEIIIRNKTGKPGKMRLAIKGPKAATVADIQADEHLELINQDHLLARVAAGGTLDIEFFVESGRGYQPAQWPVGQGLQPDNRIYLDAMFSPVRNVTFDVEKTRVGRNIDYDKLKLSIMTDGTETPVDVLHYSVSILRTQLEHFLATPEIPFNEISAHQAEATQVEIPGQELESGLKGLSPELLLKPIDALEFSVRAHNCLINAGIKRIIDLVNLTEDEVLKIKNFGAKSFEEVKEGLKSFGLSFGMNIKESSLKKGMDHESSKR